MPRFNEEREKLHKEAVRVVKMLDKMKHTQQEIAIIMNRSRNWVNQQLSTRKLDT